MIRTKAFLERELTRYRAEVERLKAELAQAQGRGDEAVRVLADLERDLNYARRRVQALDPKGSTDEG